MFVYYPKVFSRVLIVFNYSLYFDLVAQIAPISRHKIFGKYIQCLNKVRQNKRQPVKGTPEELKDGGSTYGELILDAGDVEEGLDLLPQLPPGPGAQLQVFAQVALDNLESQSGGGVAKMKKDVLIDCFGTPL